MDESQKPDLNQKSNFKKPLFFVIAFALSVGLGVYLGRRNDQCSMPPSNQNGAQIIGDAPQVSKKIQEFLAQQDNDDETQDVKNTADEASTRKLTVDGTAAAKVNVEDDIISDDDLEASEKQLPQRIPSMAARSVAAAATATPAPKPIATTVPIAAAIRAPTPLVVAATPAAVAKQTPAASPVAIATQAPTPTPIAESAPSPTAFPRAATSPAPKTAPLMLNPDGKYTVQVASHDKLDTALKDLRLLKENGIQGAVYEARVGKDLKYRVCVGIFDHVKEAREKLQDLQKKRILENQGFVNKLSGNASRVDLTEPVTLRIPTGDF